MRIYTENTENYINALALSIAKDPTSFERWKAIRIYSKQESLPCKSLLEDILANIKENNSAYDCDIIISPNHDIIMISNETSQQSMRAIAEKIASFIVDAIPDSMPELSYYDCQKQWREIRAMLLVNIQGITKEIRIDTISEIETENFGEIESLDLVFQEAKKLRKARQPKHVLLVEDDTLTRRIVSNSLKDRFAVITAHDANEAIANYLLFAPDIVFLDIGLPDASGFAALKQIITIDPEAYIVMFSGNSYLDNVVKALNSGASGFVAKPFSQEKLHYYISGSAAHYHKSA